MAASLVVLAGLAMMFGPSALNNWETLWEKKSSFVASISQNAADLLALAMSHQQSAEQKHQQIEVLARQLASAREDVETLTARVAVLTEERSEAEKALQIAQTSAAEHQRAVEQERERGEVLMGELVSAREEVEARKAAANAADASAKKAQATDAEHKQVVERERQRGEVLAHHLALARVDIETLTARVAVLTEERSEAEKALQIAQASAAEHKRTVEQEQERGQALVRNLTSAGQPLAESVQIGVALSRIEARHAVQVTNTSLLGSISPSTTRSVLVKDAAPDGPGSANVTQHTATDPVGQEQNAATSALKPQDAALGDATRVAESPPRATREHQIALWMRRGEEFTAAGDFVSARLVFQRAAETGNAKAAFMLAGTYDPAVLGLIRAMGVAPDIAKARLWYEKANYLGSPEAARRLELLVQQLR